MSKYIVFIGPPGCGKGTQATLLRDKLGYDHVSTGAVLRAEIEAGTPLGKQAKDIIEKGGFIEDALIENMLVSYLEQKSDQSGFILDGFPRTLNQGKWFENYLNRSGGQLEKVIYFFVSEEILIKDSRGALHVRNVVLVITITIKSPRQKISAIYVVIPRFLKEKMMMWRMWVSGFASIMSERVF